MAGTARADRRAFRILWIGQFAAVGGLTVVVPLLPFYLAGLGLPDGEVAWWTAVSLAAPAVAQFVTAPLWGQSGDRHGHKAMVLRAHVGLALAVGLMALADTPEQFLACRLLQGACGGVVGATATYASTLAAPHHRGRVLGSLVSATGAGSLLGPLAGSLLVGRFGFAALFGCVAALLGVAAVLALILLPHRRTAPTDAHEARSQPTLRKVTSQIVAHPRTRTLILAGVLGQAAIYALVVAFAPQVAHITTSLSSATAWVGALQAATWAASLAGGPWWGIRNDRTAPPTSFAIAAACCAGAVALQGLPTSPELLVPLRIVQGFCFAALAQSVLHVVCHVVAEQARGTALGVANSLLDAGQVCGPLLGALAVNLLPRPGTFAAIAALLIAGASLAALGMRRPRDLHPPRAALAVPACPR
jgi:MFS family permease